MGALLLLLLFLLFLLGYIPLRLDAALDGEGYALCLSVGPLRLLRFPAPPKKKKKAPAASEKKPKKRRRTAGKGEKDKRRGFGIRLEDIQELLGIVLELLGRFRRGLTVEEWTLHLIFGAAEDTGAVLQYGAVNAFLSAVGPVCRQKLKFRTCRECVSVQTAVDFGLDRPVYEIRLSVSYRLGQAIGLALGGIWAVLRWLFWDRPRRKNQSVKRGTAKRRKDNRTVSGGDSGRADDSAGGPEERDGI